MATNKHINNMRVVLIGVNDYSQYGEGDLPGSLNDVGAWWQVCLALGVRANHVKVLVSPRKGDDVARILPREVEPQEATRANILAAAGWLARELAADPLRTGLLTFSGHGALRGEERLALCPSDVKRSKGLIHNLIDCPELEAIFRDGGADKNLTVVLDTCFAGAAAEDIVRLERLERRDDIHTREVHRLSLPGSSPLPSPTAIEVTHARLSERMLLACAPDQIAYQAKFGGLFHGAFTWALTSTLLQWASVWQQVDGSKEGTWRLSLSYDMACATSWKLLHALHYEQRPRVAPRKVGPLSVFQIGQEKTLTSEDPDGQREGTQLDPSFLPNGFRKYTWSYFDSNNGSLTPVADVIVPKDKYTTTGGVEYDPDTEYWFVYSTQVPNRLSWVDTGTWDDDDPMPKQTRTFPNPRSALWTSGTNPTTFLGFQVSPDTSENKLYLSWGLTQDNNGAFTGSLTWYTSPNVQSTYFDHTGSRSFDAPHLITLSTNYYYRGGD